MPGEDVAVSIGLGLLVGVYERSAAGASGKPRGQGSEIPELTSRKSRVQGPRYRGVQGSRRTPKIKSVGREPLLHGISDQISRVLDAEDVQQLGFVILDGTHGNLQVSCNLFHALALRDQSQ